MAPHPLNEFGRVFDAYRYVVDKFLNGEAPIRARRRSDSARSPNLLDLDEVPLHVSEILLKFDAAELGDPTITFPLRHLRPQNFVARFAPSRYLFSDIKYRTCEEILKRLPNSNRALVLSAFHRLSKIMLRGSAVGHARCVKSFDQVLSDCGEDAPFLPSYLDTGVMTGVVRLGPCPGRLSFYAGTLDAEFLASVLYGCKSGIPGFDDLFGGGGLVLSREGYDDVSGRCVVIGGESGVGKSLLSLHLSVAVARAGGVAMILSLEAPPQDYRLALESFQLHEESMFRVTLDPTDLSTELEAASGRGLLCIWRVNPTKGIETILRSLGALAVIGADRRLKIAVLDPANIAFTKSGHDAIRETLRSAASALNLVYVVESQDSGAMKLAEYAADVVIRLSYNDVRNYLYRSIQVTKSRHQREQRGSHLLTILPGSGVHVTMSTAAVAARIRGRATRLGSGVRLGIPGLDESLGADGLRGGDMCALSGPIGWSRQVALQFAESLDSEFERCLFITTRQDVDSVHELFRRSKKPKSNEYLNNYYPVVALPRGNVYPGVILERIEERIQSLRLKGVFVTRVVFDTVADLSSIPLVVDDSSFLITLLEVLRKEGVFALLLAGDSTSAIAQDLIEKADAHIVLKELDYKGVSRPLVRIAKTRTMSHYSSALELAGVRPLIRASSALFFESPSGLQPLPIELCMHSESAAQADYLKNLAERLEARLGAKIDRRQAQAALIPSSAVAFKPTVQVVEVDEYNTNIGLRKNFIPDLDGVHWRPYYDNCSFLVAWTPEATKFLEDDGVSWEEVAKRKQTDSSYFGFSARTGEDINCLFLEILFSLMDSKLRDDLLGHKRPYPALTDLLARPEIEDSIRLLSRVARLNPRRGDRSQDGQRFPLITREWFTTFRNALQAQQQREAFDEKCIRVYSLPGNLSTIGTWYLGVPITSAHARLAHDIISMITAHSEEEDRIGAGVGLPTTQITASPYIRLSNGMAIPKSAQVIKRGVSRGIRRSLIGGYSVTGPILAAGLRAIATTDLRSNQLNRMWKSIVEQVGQQ
jgi:KaiC/GvpD/RAD55 family RecA-like ATPase